MSAPRQKKLLKTAQDRPRRGEPYRDIPGFPPCPDGVADVLAALAKAALPPEKVDPIAWLEEARWLSPESSREIGPFRFGRAPYLEEPQRAILDPDVPEVVLDWASQCGKSELWLNALLYWSVHAPAPALLVGPDWKSVKSLSADRIRPMMRDARLWNGDGESGDELQRGGPGSDNSAFRMTLAGKMPLTIVHASSASALAQRPARYMIFDETSRMPVTARGRAKEGDPLALGKVRLTTFQEDAQVVYVSSPVEEHQCRISELYEDSTRERWHSRCSLCHHLQILRLPEMDFETATCRCLSCGQSFTQDQWQAEKGQWIAENPGARSRRGFWLNFAVSPFVRWETVFAEWREAVHRREEGDESLFRVVLATRLTENFVEKIERMSEPEILLQRREVYPFEVPDAAKLIVAAVDTQATWLEYLICAAGSRGELWCLETGSIEGRIETDAEAMYTELDTRLLNKTWLRPDGRPMGVSRCLQDSGGHATQSVYARCRERAGKMLAYRGSHDILGPWKRGTDANFHMRLIQGNADYFKNALATRLEIDSPGPGYIHFSAAEPAGFDEEFFQQLLSERKERRKRAGVMAVRWVRIKERNEALDLLCMILCALETYRGTIDSMEPRIVSSPEATQDQTKPVEKKSLYGAVGSMLSRPDLDIGGVMGHGAQLPPDYPRPGGGWGALPGSGISV